MLQWLLYWVWWGAWRTVVSLAAAFSVQHIVEQETGIWIRTQPLMIATACFVVVIVIWSYRGQQDK